MQKTISIIYSVIFLTLTFLTTSQTFAGSERFTCANNPNNPACPNGSDWGAVGDSMETRIETLEAMLDLNNSSSTLSRRLTNTESRSVGTVAALIDANSCLHDPDFTCTEENLTHIYQTKTWTTPGNFTWTVPTGITQIYVTAIGGGGGGGGGAGGSAGGYNYYSSYHPNYSGRIGSIGGISSVAHITTTTSSGGAGGAHMVGGSLTNGAKAINGSNGRQSSNYGYINVNAGQSINIVVGAGGAGGIGGGADARGFPNFQHGGNGGSGGGNQIYGVNNSRYGGAGGDGANGSVSIRY